MEDEIPSSRHGRILIALFTAGALALIAATGWYYLRQRAAREATVTQGLTAIAEIKAKQIVNWRRERLGDGRVLMSSAMLRIAKRVLASRVTEAADRADLLDVMEKLEREFLYTGAALVGRNGTIRLQLNAAPSDPARTSEMGKATAQASDVSLQDLYWDAKLGRPLMALSVPVQGMGAFIFTIDPDRFLYPFIKLWPVPSATAETVLVRREGNRTVYLSDLRHKPGSAFHFWRPVRVPKRTKAQTNSGWVFKQRDYRGVTVEGTVVPVPDSPWYLIAKIDASEVDAPVSHLGWEMVWIIALIALANATGAGFIWRSRQMRIYQEREQWLHESAELARGQNRVLELIAENAPLQKTLNLLVRVIESLSPGMLGSILLLDEDGIHVRHGAAPNLPDAYVRGIDGEPIGPAAGSCGTAAYRREPVIVEDIATDPLWENYRDFALSHGLRACWSTPIFEETACNGRGLLGTFALYFRSPRRPTTRHRELIEMATQTAALAIVKSRETEALRKSEERLRLATAYGKLSIWEWQIDDDRLIWSEGLLDIFDWPKDGEELSLQTFFAAVHPHDRERVEAAIRTALAKHADYDTEYRVCLRDGSLRWIAAYGRAQYGLADEPVRMLGVARDITQRRQAEEEIRRRDAQLVEELKERARTEEQIQALSARLMNAQEEERSRLARELHDDLSQQIAALSMAVSNLRTGVPSELAEVHCQSERIREKLADLGEGIRRMSHELHPAILQYSGLEAALRAYCREFAALAGIQVAFQSEGSFADVPPALALCAYRVTQEALQNVLKHAQTDKADVAVTRSGGTVKLIISDDGAGMDLNAARFSGGLGLTSIRERARLVNGTVDIQSQPGGGTTLMLTMPIEP